MSTTSVSATPFALATPNPATPTAPSSNDVAAFSAAIERAAERQPRDDHRRPTGATSARGGRGEARTESSEPRTSGGSEDRATGPDRADDTEPTLEVPVQPSEGTSPDATLAAAILAAVTETTQPSTETTQPSTESTPTTTEPATAPLTIERVDATDGLAPAVPIAVDAEPDVDAPMGDRDATPATVPNADAEVALAAPGVRDDAEGSETPTLPVADGDDSFASRTAPSSAASTGATTTDRTRVAATDRPGDTDPSEPGTSLSDDSPSFEIEVIDADPTASAVQSQRNPTTPQVQRFEAPAAVQATRAELEAQLAEEFPNGLRILGAARLLRGGPGAPSSLTVNLDPAALGKLRVELTLHEGRIAVSLLAEKAQAVQAIDAQMTQLRDALEAEGLLLADLGVDLSNQGGQPGSDRANRDGSTAVTNPIGVSGHSDTEPADESTEASRPRPIDVDALVDVDL